MLLTIIQGKNMEAMKPRLDPCFQNVSDVSWKMCRTLAGENVSQRAPRVVFECVVECVVNHDTYDTFLFTVCLILDSLSSMCSTNRLI
jgi:hypothetical protein